MGTGMQRRPFPRTSSGGVAVSGPPMQEVYRGCYAPIRSLPPTVIEDPREAGTKIRGKQIHGKKGALPQGHSRTRFLPFAWRWETAVSNILMSRPRRIPYVGQVRFNGQSAYRVRG